VQVDQKSMSETTLLVVKSLEGPIPKINAFLPIKVMRKKPTKKGIELVLQIDINYKQDICK
jgi:hypothetical protein